MLSLAVVSARNGILYSGESRNYYSFKYSHFSLPNWLGTKGIDVAVDLLSTIVISLG